VTVFSGPVARHQSAPGQLLTAAPDLEEDAPEGADLVVDPDIRGEGLAQPVRSKLDGRRRMGAEPTEVGDAVECEGTPVPGPSPAVARISFDGPLRVRHVRLRLVPARTVPGHGIPADDPKQRHPMCGHADAVAVRE